jgi:plastocyanin
MFGMRLFGSGFVAATLGLFGVLGPGTDLASGSAGAKAGTVSGVVRFSGKVPKRRKISTDSDPACAKMHAEKELLSETVLVNDDGTLRNVFVWISKGLEGKTFPMPSDPVILDQNGCTFVPHIQGVRAGQSITVRNSDATTHNIHSLPKLNESFNFSQGEQGSTKTVTFKRQEVMVYVKCDIHPWMSAYLGVVDHPYFAVTADGGTFEIKDLPAGTYTLSAWHEKYGILEQPVTVADGASRNLEFTFKSGKEEKAKQ